MVTIWLLLGATLEIALELVEPHLVSARVSNQGVREG